MVKPSVLTSTTSPELARPCCHSMIAQPSSPALSKAVTPAWMSAKLLEVAQARAARLHLVIDAAREALALADGGAEGAHQRHVVDDVHELAIHRGGACGIVAVQPAPRRGEPRQAAGERNRHHHEHAAIFQSSRPSSAIEKVTASVGGSTFQAIVFSTWKIAFAVAVMRPASMPGSRSAK